MNRNAGISWTHDTWNPWYGCTKISAPCLYCYIYYQMRRMKLPPWGTVYRAKTRSMWNKPWGWQQMLSLIEWIGDRWHCDACKGHGYPSYGDGHPGFASPQHSAKCGGNEYMRMFTCSLSDFFHEQADPWREKAWMTIRDTPNCVYLILTKRPGRILSHLPHHWGSGYPNVWLGTSIGDLKSVGLADTLRKVPAAVRFLSCEPLIEDISDRLSLDGIGWVIAGGESGEGEEYKWDSTTMDWRKMDDGTKGRRTMDLSWAYRLYMKADNAGVPFFFKQVTSARSGVGADKLTGKLIHEFPAPPNGGVWWTPPAEESVQPPAGELVQITEKI